MSTYQPHQDIFSPLGSNSLSNLLLSKETKKVYNKDIKGYILNLEKKNPHKQIQWPKFKQNHPITLPFLVIQLYLPNSHTFSFDLVINDTLHSPHRLLFSTNLKKFSKTPLHTKIPLSLPLEIWTNLFFDLPSLLSYCYSTTFSSISSLEINGICYIRRILSTSYSISHLQENSHHFMDSKSQNIGSAHSILPSFLQYPLEIPYISQLISPNSIQQYQITSPNKQTLPTSSTPYISLTHSTSSSISTSHAPLITTNPSNSKTSQHTSLSPLPSISPPKSIPSSHLPPISSISHSSKTTKSTLYSYRSPPSQHTLKHTLSPSLPISSTTPNLVSLPSNSLSSPSPLNTNSSHLPISNSSSKSTTQSSPSNSSSNTISSLSPPSFSSPLHISNSSSKSTTQSSPSSNSSSNTISSLPPPSFSSPLPISNTSSKHTTQISPSISSSQTISLNNPTNSVPNLPIDRIERLKYLEAIYENTSLDSSNTSSPPGVSLSSPPLSSLNLHSFEKIHPIDNVDTISLNPMIQSHEHQDLNDSNELNVYYDPILQVYYDPNTCSYYSLK